MMSRNNKRVHRKKRVRAKISGNAIRPRISVFRSLKSIYVQLINDETGNTLASASSLILGIKPNMEGAAKVGKAIADKCKELKIEEVVFDRSGYRYHGRIKALADEMRKEGLKF